MTSLLAIRPFFLFAMVFGVIMCGGLGYAAMTWWNRHTLQPPSGPEVGQPLPSAQVTVVNGSSNATLRDALTSDGSCSLLVIVSTTCPFCMRMRHTWPRDATIWSDSVGTPVTKVWLAAEDDTTLTEFYSGYDFDDVSLVRITDDPVGTFGRLGIIGTPTTYLLDAAGHLRMGVMGDQFPPVQAGRDACTT